ncbi:hypothetical protein LUZ63_013302 [Rhynchospora breviuscula]|uniref:PROP1-like PPR domain-containing protein n=1 Tax=Rhynchospora breviuscula TaxID=2022672 RepID=A0A9Q0C8A1_9POAL|nr:hypothetical protein LUZ63_013302 [Rhynchospora breviuscula]
MELSLCPKSKGLVSSSFTTPASSSSPVSLSPVFTRIELYGSRPPRLRSRYNCRRSGFRSRIPRCSLSDSIVERYFAAIAAAAAAVATIRLVYLYCVDQRNHGSSSVEVEELSKSIGSSESVELNAEPITNHEVHHDNVKDDIYVEANNLDFELDKTAQDSNIASVVLPVEDVQEETSEEILVSSLKEEFEMGMISKSLISRNAIEFAVSSADGSSHGRSEYLKGRTTVACLKEGIPSKEKKSKRSNQLKKHEGRYSSPNTSNGTFTKHPRTNQIQTGNNDPPAYLYTYSRLLKDGRLRDCVDLLEGVDHEGLLNMDKIHHASFFNACKSRKASQEAIRFGKLIRYPRMSTFNMLLSVCASSEDFDGAYEVMLMLKEAGLQPDCKLYTTLISVFGKSGKVDTMFEVFHEMVNAGIEPTVNTYGALIDGCARAGQVAKAFGAYGIMQSKNVQPDRVIFNALITACGESGAVDRAFDVLSEMLSEPKPILPDHVTVGALIKTCIQAEQVDRAREVYKMLDEYNIRGTVEVYTIAVRSCSLNGDLQFALEIYNDMKNKGIQPDEMFLSTLIDVAGHAGKIEEAFEIMHQARQEGLRIGYISYGSLMGACCNAKDWRRALELFEEIKSRKIIPTVSMMNALITSLCEDGQIQESLAIIDEMKKIGVQPNDITFSVLIIACEKNGEAEMAFKLFEESKAYQVAITSALCGCLTGLCLQRYETEYSIGSITVNFDSGRPQIRNKWTSLAAMVYRETISAGVKPKLDALSQVLGCMRYPTNTVLRYKLIENLGLGFDVSNGPNVSSLMDGFGEYDPRSFQIIEEAAALGIVPRVSFKDSPLIVDACELPTHVAQVYLLAILKGLKHRLAAGAMLPSITIILPLEETQLQYQQEEKSINIAGRTGQAVGSLLRRLGIRYQGDESHGKLLISGISLRRWFEPKIDESSLLGIPGYTFQGTIPLQSRLAKGISDQQRNIRSDVNLSFDDETEI